VSEARWKVAVHRAVEQANELEEGPVGVQMAFTVGPGVNWPGVWKPSLDGLSPVLGRSYPDRDWNPLDGRIVRLGLHKAVDPLYGREASMVVHANSAADDWPELAWLTGMTSDERQAFFEQHRAKLRLRAERTAAQRNPAARRPVRTPDLEDLGTGSVNIVIFRDDDRGYLAWVAANPRGFVMNIHRSLNPSDARVHRARCWTIAGEPTHGKIWTGP
jgi:hypothetical protein